MEGEMSAVMTAYRIALGVSVVGMLLVFTINVLAGEWPTAALAFLLFCIFSYAVLYHKGAVEWNPLEDYYE